jgi:thymidine kinase
MHETTFEVVIGGMYSGKSTELVRRLRRLEIGGMNVILFKPRVDNRYSASEVVTHTGLKHPAVVVDNSGELWDHVNALLKPHTGVVVGVDEAQFFDDGLYDALHEITKRLNARVIVAGLDTNFKNEPWSAMVPLVFGSDRLTKLNAVCTAIGCGNTASRTQRIVDGVPVTHGDDVLVGATEAYEARCRHCFAESHDLCS